MVSCWISFQNYKLVKNRLNHYREIVIQTLPQNKHVYAICCLLEVAGCVISGGNVQTIEDYAVLNLNIDDSIKQKHIRVSL